jgi:uncharacterized delta-60 repeat protein
MKILLFLFFIPILSNSQNYVLSSTFGTNGITHIANSTDPVKSIFSADNKIVTVGYVLLDDPNPDLITHTVLIRLNQNGLADTTFGNNGIVQTDVDFIDTPFDIVHQSNGKILVGGSYTIQSPSTGVFPISPYVARYNSNGTLDTTFGTNGIFKILNFNSITSTNVYSVIPLNDGKIMVSVFGNGNGFYGALIKLNENGTIDTTFSTNGILKFDNTGYKFHVINNLLTDDNKLLLCGADRTVSNNFKSAVIKLNLDGTYDSTFGDNGKLILDIFPTTSGSSFEYFKDLKKCPDGNIIAGGWLSNNNSMIKFNQLGQLISNFGANGILQNFYNYENLVVQNDNKIIVSGSFIENGNRMFKVTRFNLNGSPDSNFNTTGSLLLDITPENDVLKSTLMDNQNALIMSGFSKLNNKYLITHVKVVTENLGIDNFNYNLSIYPNPIIDRINFSENVDLKLVQIFDINGKLISEFKNPGNINFLNISLEKGFYICKTFNKNGDQKNFKLIKS